MSDENPFAQEARTIQKLAGILIEEIEAHSWRGAQATCKEVMSTTSKLLPRLTVLLEVIQGGYAAAEVDRALARQSSNGKPS